MRISDWSSDVCSSDLRNPMKRVQFMEALLEENTRVCCEGCSEEICYRCWRAFHGEGNVCHRVHTRECPQCGVTIERAGGGPYITCSMCQNSFYWHDGMYHEDPDYFDEYGQEDFGGDEQDGRSDEHTSELKSIMRNSYA